MKEKPLISIIVPIYNVESYVEECIQSIIKQTYKNLDIILIDDGSKDSSGEICEKYKKIDSRICVVHQENQGLSSARNTGLKLANGEYIQFIDGDDFISVDMIENLYEIMEKEHADIVTCSSYTYKNGEIVKKEYSKSINIYNKEEAIKEIILDKKIRFYAWDKLYKKTLWKDIKFPEGRRFEDIAVTPIVIKNADKVVFYDCPLYYYRIRTGSIMSQKSKEQQLEYIESVLETNNYLRNNVKGIEDYVDYNIVHATINVFYVIGKYNLVELEKEEIIQKMYERTKEIMKDQSKEQFINKCCYNIKKIHLYYLVTNLKEYIKNVSYLPYLYQN